MSSKKTDRILGWLVALFAVLLTAYIAIASLVAFGQVNDLPEYFTAAKLMAAGKSGLIYDMQAFGQVEQQFFPALGLRAIGLFIPPFAAPLLLPLAWFNPSVMPALWLATLVTSLFAALFLLLRGLRVPLQDAGWLLGLSIASGPAIEGLRLGQLAPMLLLALVAAERFIAKQRLLPAGLALSFLVLKPQQMLPLVVFMFAARKFKLLLYTCGFLLFYLLLSLWIFKPDGYAQYIALIKDPAMLSFMQPQLNPTVRGQLMLLLGSNSQVPQIIGIGTLLASVVFIACLGNKWRESKDWFWIALIGAMPIGLATSLHCHDYDLLLLLPAVAALLVRRPKHWSTLAAALFCAALIQPLYTEVHYTYLLRGGKFNPYFVLLLLLGVASALYAWKFGNNSPSQADV